MCEFTISAFATSTLKCRHSGFFIKLFSALQFLRFSPNSDAKFSFNRQAYLFNGKIMRTFLCDLNHFFWFAKKMCVIFFGRIVGTKFRNEILFHEMCGTFLAVCVLFLLLLFLFLNFFLFFTLLYALFKFFRFLRISLLFRIFQHFTHFFTFCAFVCCFWLYKYDESCGINALPFNEPYIKPSNVHRLHSNAFL